MLSATPLQNGSHQAPPPKELRCRLVRAASLWFLVFVYLIAFLFRKKPLPLPSATSCCSGIFPHVSTFQWLLIVLRIKPNVYTSLLPKFHYSLTLPLQLCQITHYSWSFPFSYMDLRSNTWTVLPCLRAFLQAIQSFPWSSSVPLSSLCLFSNFSSRVTSSLVFPDSLHLPCPMLPSSFNLVVSCTFALLHPSVCVFIRLPKNAY